MKVTPPSLNITPAQVASAFRRIPLPNFEALTQPHGTTLVNLETIFYSSARPFTREITLLGRKVTLNITPAQFTWTFGDGSTATTTTPGAAFPSRAITHRYQHATTVTQHLAITWTATWAVDNGPTNPVPGTVTTVGPATGLSVREAVPSLVAAPAGSMAD